MRRILPLSLVVLVTFQTACNRDEATAPQTAPLEPAAQALEATTAGSRIAFQGCGPCSGIFVVNADGSALTQVTQSPGFDLEPSWSPDGQKIAFTRWIAGEFALAEIHVVGADGAGLTRVTNEPGFDGEPSWSPDGQRIAFVSRRDGNREIYVMNADGSAQTRLTNDPADDGQPSWSPDGQQIAFTSLRDGNSEVYVMDADGSAPTLLTNHPASDGDPTWSPDGRRIAFESDRDGNAEIYIMGADGSAPTRLTNHPAFDGDPSWSPIGQIAFTSGRDGFPSHIYVMNADGSAVTRLTNRSSSDANPTWWPWVDVTPPQFTQMQDTDSPANTSSGTVVFYPIPRATDDLDPVPEVTCTPPPGSLFPIGTTLIHCTATDNAGNTSNGAFRLTIRGPYEELGLITATVRELISSNGGRNLPTARLEDGLAKLEVAREHLAQTPPDRPEALGELHGAAGDFEAAVNEGELSAFGFSQLMSRSMRVPSIAAQQAIDDAVARGESEVAIAEARQWLAEGNAHLNVSQFKDAIAAYKKACLAVKVKVA